ncbi:MAG: sigma-70 family RNA polymerase sigma factor [Candidatus Caccosoma sp.]|nr:sigma-70 family RNA polymerase sigma factor [Candidatus Caccosoma sp.]
MDNIKEYIIKAQNNDEEAKNLIVKENISLVWSLVHRFNNSIYDKEELFQIGCVGLIKAINKFNTSYDVCFSTYAVPIILGEIKRHFRDDGALKVSRSIKELNQKIYKMADEYFNENHKEISVEELAKALNVSKADVVLAIDSRYFPTSLNEVIYEKDGSEITVEERINEKENYSLIDRITLKEELAKLSKKEQLLIKMRYYMDMNQEDIAKYFNVSQVQISRLEKKIIEKLKKQFV